jgi:hypothetical protein
MSELLARSRGFCPNCMPRLTGVCPNCVPRLRDVCPNLHAGSILAIFFYYLFLIFWDAVFYQSIFTIILTLVIPFLFIIGNISEIISYNFKVNRLYKRFPKCIPWNLRVPWNNLEGFLEMYLNIENSNCS